MMKNVRLSVVGVVVTLLVSCASVKSCCDKTGPEGVPTCGNCNVELDITAGTPVRQVNLENITDFSACYDAPPWELVMVRVFEGGTAWTYTPDGSASITDLTGPYTFDLVAAGDDPPESTNIDKVRFTLKSTSTNKTHDRGCIKATLNGNPATTEADCQKNCN